MFSAMKEHFFGINECQICFNDFSDSDIIRQLPCKHYYHKACVDPWMSEHGTCPTCRSNIVTA